MVENDRQGLDGRRKFLQTTGALGLVGLAGCIDGFGGGDDSNPIRLVSGHGPQEEVTREVVESFEEENDYTVDVTFAGKGVGVSEQVERMTGAGNSPDVIVHSSGSTYRWMEQGVVEPITDIIEERDLAGAVTVDGESYMAPVINFPMTAWYRNDVIDEEPTSWESMLSVSERLNSETDFDGFPILAGDSTHAESTIIHYLWNNGAELFTGSTDDPQVAIGEDPYRERAVETFEWLKNLSEFAPNASGWRTSDVADAMLAGNLAVGPSSSGVLPTIIEENNPDLLENLTGTILPLKEGEDIKKWFAWTEGFLLRNDGERTEAGRELISYFFDYEDSVLNYILETPMEIFPPQKDLLQNEEWRNNGMYQYAPDLVESVEENWEKITNYYQTGDDRAAQYPYSVGLLEFSTSGPVDYMILEDETPEEAVDRLEANLEELPKRP